MIIGRGPARLLVRSSVHLYLGGTNAHLSIGGDTFINQDTAISATSSVTIGERCLIGDQVSILDSDFHEVDPALRHISSGKSSPIIIGNNVWLGARVMVMKGVTIVENTVVAAGAVVTRSLPSNVLAGGVPAKIIKNL